MPSNSNKDLRTASLIQIRFLYCAADRKRHKLACNHITRTREAYQIAEMDWQNSTQPADFEDQAIIVFPELEDERAYLIAHDRYSRTLQLEHTVDAVQHSLAERFGILELDHRGVYEAREYMPLGLMRLGRDQDAYDVAKWWTLRDDGVDPRLKRMKRYKEDVFESPFEIMRSKNVLFGTLDGLLLLKIKRYNIRSHIIRERRELVENHGFVASPLVCGLKRQIRELARAVYDNPEYTGEEMEVKYIYARPSWVEMPEAAQILEDAQEGIATMAETNPYWARRIPLEEDDDSD
ncbi:MYND finger [Colletotrichum fioriniae PJ7]|uniref:MYND finger n=1 Tax=Colletotrichum fioriniae PJ7 TaxID=1445577 RepID=A0A010QIN2_9PEZI|nr:MYND finger [Colletotrichum fioriniae PJ7]